MIYLIQSAAYICTNSNEKEDILKIGYCSEDGKKARLNSYLTENPTIKVLHLIPGGTPGDERNLHIHFRHLKKPYGREWFEYCKEILDFFESHTTQESLQEINSNIEIYQRSKLLEEFGNQVKWWINSIMSFEYLEEGLKRIEISESLVNILLYNRENMEEYIKITYSDTWESIYKKYQELSQPLPSKINEYLDHFNKIPTFPDKMRYLQDVVIILTGSPELDVFLDQIPRRMRDYYEVFGFEKLKALEYREKDIKKEWERIKGNSEIKKDLVTRIYEEFQEGSSYSKSYIKDKLREIYDELGYQEAPKATKIEEYFEIKLCLLSNKETGKRDSSYQLIKKKVL